MLAVLARLARPRTRAIEGAFISANEMASSCLYLGNLNATRDWGHARDYVECMWKILQQDKAEDWVIATGVTTTIRDFVRMSFKEIGVQLEFKGSGIDEVGVVLSCENSNFKLNIGDEVVAVDSRYFRPTEVDLLIGDPSKAKSKLGWEPKYDLQALCSEMVQSDLDLFRKDQFLKQEGFKIKNEFES